MPQHNWFAGGQWNAACDICGRVFKSNHLSQDWDNSMRCVECLDGRHPQDFIQARQGDNSVPWSRPWVAPTGDIGLWANVANDIVPWSNIGGGILQWVY